MNCPIDGTPLAITERQGIEIDYCPKCRGVWLDRGELDKLIECNSQFNTAHGFRDEDEDDDFNTARRPSPQQGQPYSQGQQQPPYPPQAQPPYPQNQPYAPQQQSRPSGPDIAGIVGDLISRGLEKRSGSHGTNSHGRKKKKGGLLGELFDF